MSKNLSTRSSSSNGKYVPVLPPSLSREKVSLAQKEDKSLSFLFERVSSGSSAEYAIDQGLLLRKYSPPGKSDVAGPVTQVVIPIGYRDVAGGDDGVGPDDAVLLGRLDNSVKLAELDKLVGHLGRAVLGWSVTAAIQLSGLHASAEEYDSVKSRSELMFEKQSGRHGLKREEPSAVRRDQAGCGWSHYIIKHMRNKNDYNEEKDNWSGIARTVDRLCLFLVTPVMTFGTVIIFLRGICNQPPHLPFKGDPHDSREENPRLL
ncbi:Acetylcholine receptor subunit delta [Takifugu flavidus]|uniref:Acetylcholine receptor subunit delta n=1 Tax=Takifugu flavidus TaxID=433684 RepID=A0A5C6MH83_9TELE|nr:Acetylcholine receptor subunit delta [Takifugu flavidus]